MLFYQLFFYAVGIAFGENSFSWKELALAAFPFAVGKMWFVETYIILLLFVPFINTLIRNLNKKSHLLLIFLWISVFSVWPSFFPSPPLSDNGYGITNFITLFFIATFIRKYVVLPRSRKSVLCGIVVFAVSVLLIMISSFSVLKDRAWDYCFIFNIVASTAIFYVFLNLRETSNRKMDTVASLTYGVYVGHVNIYIRNTVYSKAMQTERFMDSPAMTIHFFICIIIEFAVFAAFDYMRKLIWKPTIGKLLDNSQLHNIENELEGCVFDQ